jgi:hypothetical protein
MADDRLVREWLEKADEDLAFAQANFEVGIAGQFGLEYTEKPLFAQKKLNIAPF